MNDTIVTLNRLGVSFVSHAGSMFVQAGILIALLWVLNHVLRRRLRASLRYALWMLVLVKLVLPPGFSLPTGVGNLGRITHRVAGVLPARGEGIHRVAGVPPSLGDRPSSDRGQDARETRGQDGRDTGNVPARLSRPGVMLVAWLAGLAVLLAALLFRAACVRRILHNAEPPGEAMLALLARCRREVGLAANVELKLTRDLSGPAVCRAWRPVILVPQALTDGLPEDKQRAILIHELCHIKRADPWVNLAQTLLQVFYFYNPLVWLANTSIRRVREQAVDERVLVCLKGQLQCYSHALIDIASALTLRARLGIGLIGVSESRTHLNERIQLMLHRPTPENTGIGCAGLVTLLVLGCTLLPMAAAHGGISASAGAAFAQADAQVSDTLLTSFGTAIDGMIAAFNGGQADVFLSHYAEDVIVMPPGEIAVVGRANLPSMLQRQVGQGAQIQALQAPNQRIWICGDLIYAAGPHTITVRNPDASTSTDSRMGVTVWQRRENGSPQMRLGAYNRMSAPPASAGAGGITVYRCTVDPPTLPANAALYDRIRDLEKRFERLFTDNKRAEGLGWYADDAMLMTGGYLFQGKAELKTVFEQNPGHHPMQDIELKFARVEGNEQMVYVIKWCGWKMKNPVSGMDYTIPGKSLHVWQHQADGSWKILLDLNNMDIMF